MIRSSAIVAVTMCTVAGAAAGVVLLLRAGGDARAFLRFDFSGTHQPSLAIAAQNARLVGAVLLGVVARPHLGRARLSLDAGLAVVFVGNATLVGIALGAYGTRTVRAVALHGPLELAALSLAGGVYLSSRRSPVAVGPICVVAASCAALLVISGVVETSVQIGGPQ